MDNCEKKCVIVVMDADSSSSSTSVDALDWALKHVVRHGDTIIVLGVLCDLARKNSSCMGLTISGIWERLEFSRQGEARSRELGCEIERKKQQYRACLQPFYRQCRKYEVKLQVKLAAGFCPQKITVQQAQTSCPRWIVLDSHLKKYKLIIYGHVGCNIAVMKGKDIATWLPSRPRGDNASPSNFRTNFDFSEDLHTEHCPIAVKEPRSTLPPKSPCWYPLSWRSGFPRVFTQTELEIMTNAFADENLRQESDDVKIYEGLFQETPIIIQRFTEKDEQFWLILNILSRVRHRHIMNLIGYCCTSTCLFLLSDFPCMGTLETQFQSNDAAQNMPWEDRWCIALQIGASLRYLHEECADGAIAMLSVSSSNVAISHGCCSMLCNFSKAQWLKVDDPSSEDSQAQDIHDYGMFLIELISGKSNRHFRDQNYGQPLTDWALPFLQNGSLGEIMDQRLVEDSDDAEVVHHMAQAALLCLKSDSSHRISMDDALAVVRGDQLATAYC